MKTKVINVILLLVIISIPKLASAFWFSDRSNGYLNASAVPATLGPLTSSSVSAYIQGNGNPTPTDKDLVRVSSVYVNGAITSRGFTVEFYHNGSWMSGSSLNGQCVWSNPYCNTNSSGSSFAKIYISLRLKRTSTAAYTPIPDNTLIARVSFLQYSQHGGGATNYIEFYTRGDIAPVNPTCNVKDFDKTVMLPPVNRNDISSHGVGRYSGATKEFDITLECSDKPKISVKFDGDKMTGIATDEVLANKATGNDNVGIQILHKDNPIKFGTAFEILTSTQKNESLKFNAYYYYKGGTVSPGPVKAQAEFLFTYK